MFKKNVIAAGLGLAYLEQEDQDIGLDSDAIEFTADVRF